MPPAIPYRIVGIVRIEQGIAIDWCDPLHASRHITSTRRIRLSPPNSSRSEVAADTIQLKQDLDGLFESLVA